MATNKLETLRHMNIWSLLFLGEIRQEEPSSMELIAAVKIGLPGAVIGQLAQIMDVSRAQIYSLLNLKPKTGQRASKMTSLSVHTSDRIVQILKVFARCTSIFVGRKKASQWLKSPNLALRGEAPLQIMDTIEGISLVNDTITRIEYGVFA